MTANLPGAVRRFLRGVRWLLTDGRPAGEIGRPVGFSGHWGGVEARAELVDGGWHLRDRDGRTAVVDRTELARLSAIGEFLPDEVVVVPQLAPLLFQEAVAQAEESLARVRAARDGAARLQADDVDDGDVAIEWVLGSSALDRAVRAGSAAVVLAVAALEAQLNEWGALCGGLTESQDHASPVDKCKVVAEVHGRRLVLGREPFQRLREVVELRHAVTHSKPVPEARDLGDPDASGPGVASSLQARRACVAVREGLIEVARTIGADPPGYLAYCPEGDPADEDAWRNAVLTTGVRDDSVFPPAGNPGT